MTKGRVTIPTDVGIDKELKNIINRWGGDAIRDCDGTKLSDEITDLDVKVYSTYLPTRNDQEWAKNNPDQLQQLFVMSDPVIATSSPFSISIMKGFFEKQFSVNVKDFSKDLWEVRDRTTGELVNAKDWDFTAEENIVTLHNPNLFHEYTVSFLVYQIWDPTQMFNHITNDWGDKAHEMPYDARHPETLQHMKDYLAQWINENPSVDVVRFTTFFYHFTLIYNEKAKEKFVDWFGYTSSLSKEALDDFEKEKGYKLNPEVLIDEGYYNSPFRIPTKEFLDFVDFQAKFVSTHAKEMVDMVHESGKEAMMFLGDNWIGTEPYGPYFEEIGMDAVVGSVGNGTTMRMISDIPGVKYTEGRFLPYFFPDVFNEDGDPVKEAKENWSQARRAILRKPLDRIGYGGYLGLALQFPEFVDAVEKITEEFREIHDEMKGTKAYTAPFKVGVLNSWGKMRTWQTNQVAHAMWYKEIYSYVGVVECLSGMSVDVEFINFEDIKKNGIPNDIGVLINAGDAYTSWSGGENWLDEDVLVTIRKWVYNGGAFIGIGEPSAYQNQGKMFQLWDVLGVDKDITYGLSYRKYHEENKNHFILEEYEGDFYFGEEMKGIYQKGDQTQVLQLHKGDVSLSTNEYGKGRSVYMAGLPYTPENCRLLLRSLYWVTNKEDEMKKYWVTNPKTECAAFEDVNRMVVINNSSEEVETNIYLKDEFTATIKMEPFGYYWLSI